MPASIPPIDVLAISSISAEFGYLVDQGRALECTALFTPDARMIFGPGSPRPGTLEGIESIREFLTARQAQTHVNTRHIATNFRLHARTADEVELTSLLQVFRSDTESRQPIVAIVADIAEVFVRTQEQGWKIRERLTTPIFVNS